MCGSITRDSPFSRTFNGILASVLRRAAALVGDRPLRILEIGAGTGGTTRYLLPEIDVDFEYTFTDISPLFLTQAKDRFKNDPRLRVALLDIERSPAQQGFEAGAYDSSLRRTCCTRRPIFKTRCLTSAICWRRRA